ncbi:MAG: aminodeoxychorismate lyase [Candidatus Thiodiazotropha taylori]|nr:aminodeoxychorismate lyase [Candidatus Thiodiazotropha taylori]MCW4328365.1 aminodeoxychorismate lyase [Candidatus Thiodiazotropha taylori]
MLRRSLLLIDGLPADQIPITDRGLQYGDGLFETIAVKDGLPCLWQRHMARLEKGEQVLGFTPTDKQQLWQEALQVAAGKTSAVLKIVVTRGSGGRGYRPPSPCHPRRILSIHPWPDYPAEWYEKGIEIRICETRLSNQAQLAGIKHLNRLEQVLARAEWDRPDIAEGLMLDQQDRVVCGTQSNLFLLKGDQLLTPRLSNTGVAGVVRELVLESAEQFSLKPRLTELSVDDLKQSDALFMTNAIMGLCPVVRFEQTVYELKKIPPELMMFIGRSYLAAG